MHRRDRLARICVVDGLSPPNVTNVRGRREAEM